LNQVNLTNVDEVKYLKFGGGLLGRP
jgi:hypothetical protein